MEGCSAIAATPTERSSTLNYHTPPGFPDGQLTQVMKDEAGQPTDLRDRATGAVIEVLVDHDAGTLRYRINGASRRTTASRRAPRCGRAPHWLDMRTV